MLNDDEIRHMMVYFVYAREGSPRVQCQQTIYNYKYINVIDMLHSKLYAMMRFAAIKQK
jgi:hypothetical protein